MEDRSNIQQKWFSIGTTRPTSLGTVILDILVRWNERISTKKTDDGEVTEYVYDARRVDIILPKGTTAEEYLEMIKEKLLANVVVDGKIASQKPINTKERLMEILSEAESMKAKEVQRGAFLP